MNRREVLALSGALAAAVLAGCTGDEGTSPQTSMSEQATGQPASATRTATPDEPTETPPSGDPNVDDERLADLAAGNAAFALDLHGLLADEEGGNQFFSPYSISVALAMTVAGARGETREEMREALHYMLGEEIHPAFADLQAALESRETTTDPVDDEPVEAFQIDVANAVWGKEEYPFAEDYLDLLSEHYGAGLRTADFAGAPDSERERINQWVADVTENRIEDLLPSGSITPSTVMVLTNAIYFMAGWAHQFDPEDTEDGTFTALDGTESTVPFMHQNIRTNYAEIPGAETLELPYVGEDVSMVLVLPEDGNYTAFESNLDADRLFGIFEALSDAKGTLALPKFEYETGVQLKDALSALGMPGAFDSSADFSGMVKGDDGPWIDAVYHEAFVSVDEEGTEAAASTAVAMEESVPPEWGELRFDRPFLYCIRDRPTDAVLFLGRVVDAGDAQG
ncbi:MAG: serpin B [Halobacteriales archaeon]|jgi:serpin B